MATQNSLFENQVPRPLADRLRAHKIEDVVGQEHILRPEALLGRLLAAKKLVSLILWGPPGCGKTTLARLLAAEVGLFFEQVPAVAAGVADLRKVFETAALRRKSGQGTLLFVDEIHRFNRAQQDVLLPYVEDGTITLVGATTENPSFELNNALLSRCQVLVLRPLNEIALEQLLQRAESLMQENLSLTQDGREALKAMADGDGRYLLTLAEELFGQTSEEKYDAKSLAGFLQKHSPLYDKAQEGHYNLMSALHKSLRGSDCDAALYWFARMLQGGEDPLYIGRRLLRFASEDIGLADPQALTLSLSATETFERLGSPEGELALAEAVVYLATAPKSNSIYVAYKAVRAVVEHGGSLPPPKHILNAPTQLLKEIGYSECYIYDHDTPEGFSGQNYFPEAMKRHKFYKPQSRGFEREIQKRLEYWEGLRVRKK